MKYIRYTLAALCVAVSVGCLALWWRSYIIVDHLEVACLAPSPTESIRGATGLGYVMLAVFPTFGQAARDGWSYESEQITVEHFNIVRDTINSSGRFAVVDGHVFSPLWYPALVFALAGVGALRFRRQFSIRSALICLSVVALLLGMVVAL